MKIKNATKKEIRELLKIARNYGNTVYEVGAFIYNNKVHLYLALKGQGINALVYNKQYDTIVSLIDFCDKRDYTLTEAINAAYETIADMIDFYEEDNKGEK